MTDIIHELTKILQQKAKEREREIEIESSLCPWLQRHFKGHDILIPKIPAEIQDSIKYNTDQVKVEFHVDIEIYKVFQELYLEDKEFKDYINHLQNKLNKQKIIC